MYIFKNAWKNIVRNKGRNILIGIIIVVIAAATSVTLAISNTSKKLIDSYKNSQQVEATISVNREKMREQMKPPTDGESFEDMKNNFGRDFSGGPPNMPGSSDSSNKSSKSSKGDMPTRGMKSVQAYDSIDAAVDFKVLLELLGIGIILSLVSSSASMIAIERFQPLEILKERS